MSFPSKRPSSAPANSATDWFVLAKGRQQRLTLFDQPSPRKSARFSLLGRAHMTESVTQLFLSFRLSAFQALPLAFGLVVLARLHLVISLCEQARANAE